MNIWAKTEIMVYAVVMEALMEKVEIVNDLGLTVFINGKPSLALMPQDVIDVLCSSILTLMGEEMRNSGADAR